MSYQIKEYKFIAKEQIKNEPFITIESMRGEISEFENSIIYLWVDDGGIKKAQEIASILNHHVTKIGFERLEQNIEIIHQTSHHKPKK